MALEQIILSHFFIDLTGFWTIENFYPPTLGWLQGVVFGCQPNGFMASHLASLSLD